MVAGKMSAVDGWLVAGLVVAVPVFFAVWVLFFVGNRITALYRHKYYRDDK